MNKVITINLNGVAYQLEEGGYDALRVYLDNAARRLEGNPDKDEIITDIEQAIADKFRALLGAYKTVVNTKEVTGVITAMGPVQDTAADETPAGAAGSSTAGNPRGAGKAATADEPKPSRRLYRITDGAMLSGLCNGLAAHFNVDVTFVRLAFVILSLFWGTGVLLYFVMSFIVPVASTPEEKAEASGMAATAQEFIKRAREGYYEGMKSFHDKQSRREWKRKFKRDMRGWKHGFHRQMQEESQQWQQNWAQHMPPVYGPVFLAPLLSILLFALFVVMLWAIYSLVTVHTVLGVALPASMPLWVGILLVVVAFQLVAWPIKAVRYSCCYPRPHCGYGGPWGGLFGSLIGLFFLAFGIWSLDRHVPEFHEWLVQLPALLHRCAEVVQGWFAGNPGAK